MAFYVQAPMRVASRPQQIAMRYSYVVDKSQRRARTACRRIHWVSHHCRNDAMIADPAISVLISNNRAFSYNALRLGQEYNPIQLCIKFRREIYELNNAEYRHR